MAVLFLLLGCGKDAETGQVCSAYYWSTVFRLDSVQRGFLEQHRITRLYIRYFDVVDDDGQPMPNATIQFSDSVPTGVEVVPTVFILNECMSREPGDLAEKIVKRVLQMNETHDIGNVHELQIDCDWTQRTEKNFFVFMEKLRNLLREKDIRLSSTIRLHQLAGRVPPVDRGVLMVYNTGDFTDLHCEKPILDKKDVAPYLRYVADYSLPLSAAYPLFDWRILFRGGKYVGIMHGEEDLPVLTGDSIVTRDVSLDEILTVKRALQDRRKDVGEEIVLYELGIKNITKYNTDEYEKILDY